MNPFLIPGLDQSGTPEDKLDLDLFAIQGEAGTGFEKAGSLGEFECGNCLYFDSSAGACNQETMKAVSKQPRLSDGRVSVGPEDCCEYVRRVSKKCSDES